MGNRKFTAVEFKKRQDEILGDVSFNNYNTSVFVLIMPEQRSLYHIPNYQRDYVWTDKMASRYIESLLLRLPIAPIILHYEEDFSDSDLNSDKDNYVRYTIIDGSQRVRSLWRFVDNELKLCDCNLMPELNGLRYMDFDENLKRVFQNGNLSASQFKGKYNNMQILNIFNRINTCTPLTKAQLEYATNVLSNSELTLDDVVNSSDADSVFIEFRDIYGTKVLVVKNQILDNPVYCKKILNETCFIYFCNNLELDECDRRMYDNFDCHLYNSYLNGNFSLFCEIHGYDFELNLSRVRGFESNYSVFQVSLLEYEKFINARHEVLQSYCENGTL